MSEPGTAQSRAHDGDRAIGDSGQSRQCVKCGRPTANLGGRPWCNYCGSEQPESAVRLPLDGQRLHHLHGVYYGDDNWDAECCICGLNPCGSVDAERLRLHAVWSHERAAQRAARQEAEDAPF